MRLLFVSNLFPPASLGGYEQVCRTLRDALLARGHEVTVLTGRHRREEVDAEVGVERLLDYRSYGFMGSARRGRPWAGAVNARALRQMVRDVDAQAVVVWGGSGLGRGVMVAAEALVPTVYYLHDTWLADVLAYGQGEAAGSRLSTSVGRALAGVGAGGPRGERAVFISASLRSEYLERGLAFDDAPVVRNGLDPQAHPLRPQRILERAEGEPARLLYVGRVSAAKGAATLVEAMAGIDARLDVVGPFEGEGYEAQLRSRVARLELEKRVRFHEAVPREEVPALFAEHDLLVFPSQWREPLALTLLEGMAAGIPVVTTLTGGSPEVATDGVTAYAFHAGQAAQLAERVRWCLANPGEAAATGRRASEHVHREFTLTRQVDALEALLQSTVGGRFG